MNIAYTALHYGSPYLEYAIRSVIHTVDKFYVLYAAEGSHGAKVQERLPASERRANLYEIAERACNGKLVWIDGKWEYEGQQRDSIHLHAPDADVILVVDYDEIWGEGVAEQAIQEAQERGYERYRLPMLHYWRSFRKAILHDPAYPTRVICPNGEGEEYIHTKKLNHMGYAIPTWLLDYKMKIHGHRGEWRKDINWRVDRWDTNAQFDCHPVGSEYWNTETINPLDYMPDMMKLHPYYGDEVIE
jgi:hypothetical protein